MIGCDPAEKLLEKYFYFLRTTKELANNTAVDYITFVKTIFHPAIQDHILKTNPFALKGFSIIVILPKLFWQCHFPGIRFVAHSRIPYNAVQ